jgi:phosphoserine phosphatase
MGEHLLVLTWRRASEPVPPTATQIALSLLANEEGATIQPADGEASLGAWRARFTMYGDRGTADLLGRLRAAPEIIDRAIDVNILTAGNLRKKLLVADMESTIIEQEMLDELGDLIGKRAHIADITARAMRGELDFEAALKERVGLLAGLPAAILDQVATRITLMPGARELVATMKAHGATCALVSGGFTVFTAKVAAMVGFDEHRANTLEIADGKLTGRVVEPILGREAKLATLVELCHRLDIATGDAIAVGDGANDLAMLRAAGLGVAFRAKPIVAEQAAVRIDHGDLRALLALQGFKERST